MTTALVFPGQGAEEPAMGLALARADPDAASILAIASEVTGVDVPRALERGGKALAPTEVLQPVLAAVGLASARALARRGVEAALVAGHSLGELTAACFAAGLDVRRAIELAALRGRAMAEASRAMPGGMVAVRASEDEVRAALEGLEGVELAAINAADEIVVSGRSIEAVLARFGARATRLRVSGAWHSRAMAGAALAVHGDMRAAFEGSALGARVIASEGELDASSIARGLADAIAGPVRFTTVLARLEAEGVTRVIVCAPSRVVRSLVRRTLRDRVELTVAE